jgi:AcrR family transcriptional regulator
MGRQAVSKVQTGATGTGTNGGGEGLSHAPTLKLVMSPKRERIINGMLEAVGAEGYDATSVRTVLDRTGLYRQAFYDNFEDKDECYLEAFEVGVERLEALAIMAAASQESWRGKLRAGLGAILDYFDEQPDVGRAIVVEVHAAGAEALKKRAEAMKRVTEFIDRARLEAETDESEEPPNIAPEAIVSGIHAVVHSRLSTGAEEGFRQLLPEFMYFAVLPYFGAEDASAEMAAARA